MLADRSNFHYIATAAMMAEELGGVVDSDLLVYGVDNVRVVDASVIPFQVCGHLTAVCTSFWNVLQVALLIPDRPSTLWPRRRPMLSRTVTTSRFRWLLHWVVEDEILVHFLISVCSW